MKETGTYFRYSKANEYSLEIPAELKGKIGKTGRRIQAGSGKKSFNFMFVIRIAAVAVFIAAVCIFAKRVNEYTRDIKFNDSIVSKLSASSHKALSANTRATPVYPKIEGEEIETGRFDYPQWTDSVELAQYSLTYPDFVFWLLIEDTTVNYPVVQAKDNDYYLRRNIDGQHSQSGTLFMDYRCSRETLRRHNIIYGHNNQNGTMFGTLRKYLDKSYYDAHSEFFTYSKDSVIKWKIFSAYETTTDNYYIQTYFSTDEKYEEFLNKLKASSKYDTGVEVTAGDDILTLSTCHLYTNAKGRFVVHAVKVGETPLR